jgi:hypothetical protein
MRIKIFSKKKNIIKHSTQLCLLAITALIFISCASAKVSQSRGHIKPDLVIALAPSGGVLAEAIGIELFNKGFTVIDTAQMSNLMLRYNMTELELSKPQNLKALKEEGIDGILTVKSVTGYDGKPQSATVRINSTKAWSEIIAGVSWQNGWGGRQGSLADRSKRKDITGAAKQIVRALIMRGR